MPNPPDVQIKFRLGSEKLRKCLGVESATSG